MSSSHTHVGSISTRASDGTSAGLLLSGTSISHHPATGGSASGSSFNLATGAHVAASCTLDPDAAAGGAIVVSNSTTQTSGDLVSITGVAGQSALNVAAGDTTLQGTTIADGSNDLVVASHDGGSNGLKLGEDLVTATATELNYLDGSGPGTVVADTAVVYNGDSQLVGELFTAAQPNVTSVGSLTGLTIADGSNDLVVASHDGGSNGLKLGEDLVTATATELNYLDGSGPGTVVADTAVVYNGDSQLVGELFTAAQPNVTSVGSLVGLTIADGSNDLVVASHDGTNNGLVLGEDLVTATATELNYLDGATPNVVVNEVTAVYGSNGELAGTLSTAAQPNVTSLGAQAQDLDMGAFKISNMASPSADDEAATKGYVDAQIEGVDYKQEVRVASTGPVDISELNNGDVVDGVTLATGDRVLLKDQVDATENGVYVVGASAGSTVRAVDFAAGAAASGAAVQVLFGTANALRGYVCSDASGSDVVGTYGLTFALFHEGPVTAGDGLSKNGLALSVNVDDSSLEIDTDTLQIKASGVTNAMLNGSIADSKLSQLTTADKVAGSAVQLAATTALEDNSGLQVAASLAGNGLGFADQVMSVNVDDSSLEIDTDALQIKALGVTNAMLNGSIADSKLSQLTTADKVAGSAVQLAATTALEDNSGLQVAASLAGNGLGFADQIMSVNVDDSSLEIDTDALRIKASGVTNAMLEGSITMDKISSAVRQVATVNADADANLEDGTSLTIAAYNGATTMFVVVPDLVISANRECALPSVPAQGAFLRVVVQNLSSSHTYDLVAPSEVGHTIDGNPDLPAVNAGAIAKFEFIAINATTWALL